MAKKNVMKKDSTDSLYFNEGTQARIKDFIGIAKTEINKIEKALQVQLGLIIATYYSPVRGFIEQNIIAVIFVLVVIGIRPMMRFWTKK